MKLLGCLTHRLQCRLCMLCMAYDSVLRRAAAAYDFHGQSSDLHILLKQQNQHGLRVCSGLSKRTCGKTTWYTHF